MRKNLFDGEKDVWTEFQSQKWGTGCQQVGGEVQEEQQELFLLSSRLMPGLVSGPYNLESTLVWEVCLCRRGKILPS